ncbi:hypothetical protein KMP11_03070 [Gemella sp. zg-570]|uniref:hypothetical protein n=1 Tax=Gemella sp. zg-570 TaxID=2840371 RepID=UPI001C0E8B27|nr:hypothetical protein [Gemella sp. zg-570]QWQ39323.1 hypothetical protein KMP11_03070 [Gemella sp. zg-570]
MVVCNFKTAKKVFYRGNRIIKAYYGGNLIFGKIKYALNEASMSFTYPSYWSASTPRSSLSLRKPLKFKIIFDEANFRDAGAFSLSMARTSYGTGAYFNESFSSSDGQVVSVGNRSYRVFEYTKNWDRHPPSSFGSSEYWFVLYFISRGNIENLQPKISVWEAN